MNEEQQKQNQSVNIEYEREEEGISLSELFQIIKSRFKWCVVGFVIVLALGIAYIKTTIPQYESSATILVDPIKQSSTMDSILTGDVTGSKKIATEAELITSSLNIKKALSLLDLSLYHNNEGVPYSDGTILGGPNAVASLKKRLAITTVKDTNIVKFTFTDSSPLFARDFVQMICSSYDDILTSISKDSKSAQRQFIENQIPVNDAELKKANDALGEFRENTNIIELTDKTSLLVSENVYYQMRLEPLQMEYKEAQVGIEQYQKDWKESGLGPLPTVEQLKQDPRIREELAKLQDLLQELVMYDAVNAMTVGGSSNMVGGTGTIIGMNNSTINDTSQTISRISELTNSILQLKKTILDSVISLCGKKVGDNYDQSIARMLATEVQIAVLQDRADIYKNELGQLPGLQRKLSELQREVNVYESVGLKLRDMLQETRLVEAAVSGNVKVIDTASFPASPVSPNKLLILAVSMLLGLAIGVLLALFVDMHDDTIRNNVQLKKIQGAKIPLLSWIPFIQIPKDKEYPTLVVYNDPLSFESERFKLVANLLYSREIAGKIYSITSCGMSEGKSTVIANVAVSLSQMGKKVLLVDGDLRAPSISNFFNIKNHKLGLVDNVIKDVPLQELIVKPIDDIPNLHLLPAGSKPLVPAAIFSNPNLKKILEKLKSLYDFIIIDAPPLLYASELFSVGKMT
ncbi:MAG: polysaccharide biosynthesis tyrosine autokinase, partial [Sphaerochaetaceae bacterium]